MNKVTKYKFKGKMKCYQNSCTGIVDNGKIVVIGGSDSSGLLNNHTFIIDPRNKSAKELIPAPKPVKDGHLLEYKSYYYCVGGTVESESVDSLAEEEGSPIMRFNTVEYLWEVFNHTENSIDNIDRVLRRKITDKEDFNEFAIEQSGISLKHIISSGAFLFYQRIYLVGGKVYQEGGYNASDKIFSFGLEENSFILREESFKLPVKLINPTCAAGSSNAIISGGKLEDGHYNLDVFIIKLRENEIIKSHSKLDSPIEENYPPSYLEHEVVLFSFPKLWIRPKNIDQITFTCKAFFRF